MRDIPVQKSSTARKECRSESMLHFSKGKEKRGSRQSALLAQDQQLKEHCPPLDELRNIKEKTGPCR